MVKDNTNVSIHPECFPQWYWTRGLHDACIVGIQALEFSFDYSRFLGEKKKYNRNCLTLKINAQSALFDTSVKEIRLFNYKILTQEISLDNRSKMWWISDRLENHGDYYILEVDLRDFDSYPEDFTFKIKFDRAEVDRR